MTLNITISKKKKVWYEGCIITAVVWEEHNMIDETILHHTSVDYFPIKARLPVFSLNNYICIVVIISNKKFLFCFIVIQ